MELFQKHLSESREAGDRSELAGKIRGVITPHIDFRVSLTAYAQAFAPLACHPQVQNYVILGVGHRSGLEWNLDRRDYETPLGVVTCDDRLVDRLAGKIPERQIFGPKAHEGEHSIEFALVWLQALHRLEGKGREFRFVPVLCGGMHRYVEGEDEWDDLNHFHQLARALSEIVNECDNSLRIIVSIDGCHMGPRFGHGFRVDAKVLRDTERWEECLWSQVASGKARTFLDWVRAEGNERYFDGVGALALLLEAMRGQGTVERTHYEQWFTQKDASVVTFSSGVVAENHQPESTTRISN